METFNLIHQSKKINLVPLTLNEAQRLKAELLFLGTYVRIEPIN